MNPKRIVLRSGRHFNGARLRGTGRHDMATRLDHERLDFDEQIVRIEKMIVEMQSTRLTIKFEPRKMFIQATLAAAALMGAGAAIARFFLPG
jgi:hypothetical protein